MKKILFTLLAGSFLASAAMAQVTGLKPTLPGGNIPAQPFLFSVNTLTGNSAYWAVNASSNYAQRSAGAFGYDGADQQIAVKGYLGNRFTLYANADLGFANNGGVASAQQAEIIRDFVGGKQAYGLRFGVGLGANRDFLSVGALFSRITASFESPRWRMGGNLRLEKAFAGNRDGIDLVTSFGFQHRLAGPVFAGFEIMGQDLEGFWEADEAEGGAKLLIGPSINVAPQNSRFSFSVSGGPVFYATHSTAALSGAIRDIGNVAAQNGYTLRAMVSFNLRRY
ncbi:hypothetical protein [Mucilaginibacter gilvus]|uniref:Uncharacterized protein n=1 Tax=Mucilaginibacter gilvus TaxID=2305909 RepID=A0A444MR19_9SPHI|nr:hypothetical protein [Mucilaginibacter gilvus]RWY54054.1 hypothetical protein EPL05_08385 [Mucilaginibacter gilvus]